MKRLSILITILFTFVACSSSEHVNFPDSNLANAIRDELHIPPNAPISIKKLQELKRLNAPKAGIKDLTGLENAVNLLYLTLSENQISDISPLTGLTQLISLDLRNNQIGDISPLTQLTNLIILYLSQNRIADIRPLSQLAELLILFLDENQISDISELSSLRRLPFLSLTHNQIKDISSLTHLRDLKGLQLEHNQIDDISPLYGPSELIDLRLAHNRIHDISPLKKLKKLEVLHLKANPIEDRNPLLTLFANNPDLIVDVSTSDLISQDLTRLGLPPEAIRRIGKGVIKVMRFSPDGSKLAVGSSIGASIYDVDTGSEIPMQVRRAKEITAVAFSNDGKRLATSGYNTPIEMWDVATGKRISVFKRSSPAFGVISISSVSIHPGAWLAFSEDNTTLIGLRTDRYFGVFAFFTLWDVAAANLIEQRQCIEGTVTVSPNTVSSGILSLSNNQNTIAIGRSDGKIGIWDLKIKDRTSSLNKVKLLKGHHQHSLRESIMNLFIEEKYHQTQHQPIRALALSPDGKTLITAGTDNSIRISDLIKGTNHVIYEDIRYWISSMDFSKDGNTVAITMGTTIRLWDITTNTERASLEGHTSGIESVVFSPDGKTLASGSNDGTIRFWDINTGKELSAINAGYSYSYIYTYSAERVQFSKDNTILVSSSAGDNKKGWDVNTGIELPYESIQNVETKPATFTPNVTDRSHTNMEHIISTAEAQLFSPDTRLYLTAGRRNSKIRIWDFFNTGEELLTLPFGHTATITTLAFSHDGKTLASAGEDGTILLWDWDKIAAKAKPLDR